MAGPGVTRPDRIYCNKEAMAFIRSARTICRDDNASHAILEVDLDIAMFQSHFRMLKRPEPFDMKLLEGKQEKGEQEERAERVWGNGQEEALQAALAARDVEGAWATWCKTAEMYLIDLTNHRRGEEVEPKEEEKMMGKRKKPEDVHDGVDGDLTKKDAAGGRHHYVFDWAHEGAKKAQRSPSQTAAHRQRGLGRRTGPQDLCPR